MLIDFLQFIVLLNLYGGILFFGIVGVFYLIWKLIGCLPEENSKGQK